MKILGSDKVLRRVITQELRDVKKKFGDDRRTEIGGPVAEISIEDLIADEDMAITVTHNSYLKRTPVTIYRQQSRGGRGRIGMGTRTEDFIEHLLIGSAHSYVLVFTNLGRLYWLKVYDIPEVGVAGRGKNIVNLVNLQATEKVQAFLPVKEFTEGQFVVMATRRGVIKKCPLPAFRRPMTRGIIAVNLDRDDELISARLTDGEQQIFVATRRGKAIRFDEKHEWMRCHGSLRLQRSEQGWDQEIGLERAIRAGVQSVTCWPLVARRCMTEATPSCRFVDRFA